MAKNVTISYLVGSKPDRVIHYPPPSIEIPANRRFIPRLGWGPGPFDATVTYSALAQTVSNGPLPDARFFLDTCFVTGQEIEQCLWDALLQRQILITPLVWAELRGWLENPVVNKGFRDVLVFAYERGHPAITFFNTDQLSSQHKATALYYTELLGLRKRLGLLLKLRYKKQHGREPTEEELQRECQEHAQDRGLTLAKKGLADHSKPNFLADEELVVLAVMSAIISGHETTILTRDNDLIEQFYKLLFIIDTHYRCMLLADEYTKQPLNFLVSEMPNHPRSRFLFQAAHRDLVRYPGGFLNEILPKPYSFVMLYCWRIGGTGESHKLSTLHFCAEREMSRLFDIKGQTGGRNTQSLGERNCHIYFDKRLHDTSPCLAAIAADNLLPAGKLYVPVVDYELAIQRLERVERVECAKGPSVTGDSDTDGLAMRLAGWRLRDRLCLRYVQPPNGLPTKAIAAAITYSDPRTFFVPDCTFLCSRVEDMIADALFGRGYTTTDHIRQHVRSRVNDDHPNRLVDGVIRGKRKERVMPPCKPRAWHHDCGYGYYVGVLAFRKLLAKALIADFEEANNRQPSECEWRGICMEHAGEYGVRLGEAGLRRQDDPSLFFSEETLVFGLVQGILTGMDVVVLTKDVLVMEQFAKLGGLVRRHYRTMLFGNEIAKNPNRFPCHRDGRAGGTIGPSADGNVLAYEAKVDDVDGLLPKDPYLMNMHCWYLGDCTGGVCRFATLTFCAERPMYQLLNVKGATGGRNTELMGDKNIHIRPRAGPEAKGDEVYGLVMKDRAIEVGSRSFPADDRLTLNLANFPAFDLVLAANNIQ